MTRAAFVWTKSPLDRRSGAALSVKTMLEVLAAAGFDCRSYAMTVFDGREDYPVARLVGKEAADPGNRGTFVEQECNGVRHHLFVTSSTRGPRLRQSEGERYLEQVGKNLRADRPDIVLTMGNSDLSRELHALAAEVSHCRIFYLANPSFDDPGLFQDFQHIWCPTRALADLYRERLDLDPEIVPSVLPQEAFLGRPMSTTVRPLSRRFLTFMNPMPEKGATVVFQLARLAARERPDLRFAVVEGRAGRGQWRFPEPLPNLFWLRTRRDVRAIYRRTALLLFPSLWFEAAGRVLSEAQLSGIPVLATDRGGIPEQLNGGGFLFEPPAQCLRNYLAMPHEIEVRPWLDRIVALMDDPAAYAAASHAARTAAEPFHPRLRHPRFVDHVAGIVAELGSYELSGCSRDHRPGWKPAR